MTRSANTTISQNKTLQRIRKPSVSDGAAVWKLVKETQVLDVNSSYSYLMWCSNFSDTSVIIEVDHKIVGFISAYIKQESPDRLFVWQIAVDQSERGKGLASKMLHQLLKRDACVDIQYIETTISPTNIPSQNLFKGVARDLQTELVVSELFTSKDFPEKGHEDEQLHEIGPF